MPATVETTPSSNILLKVENLKMHFPVFRGVFRRRVGQIKAVDGISFDVIRGETLGLVGESGCGKSTAGRTILQLYRPTAGSIILDGEDLSKIHGKALRHRRRKMQMIFQDPYASLNPRMTIGEIVSEPLEVHDTYRGKEKSERVAYLLQVVGLNPLYAGRYPHEFSGGQRQRVGIARALALDPSFIVCDEPISALDVSIQAQVVNLLEDIQKKMGLTYLFIAHDLSMVRHISNRVAVMYLGKLMELADRAEVYIDPLHPYTQALLSAIPIPDPVLEEQRKRVILTGDVPSPANPPSGCVFHTRCMYAERVCTDKVPDWREAHAGHWVACHFAERFIKTRGD
ncbi:MAG: dipeptide ABC transporter ATP-binding protein [Anaerolineales bacterium]|nr:dipeptide ABC transporter ATP-binding protein [Anaerolineales bacterium]